MQPTPSSHPRGLSDSTLPHHRHLEHPKSVAEDDFWGQVSRTINGEPVAETQIQMIVQAIGAGLQLQANDHLLDLACGNGALAARVHQHVASCMGVDFSHYLVQIARRYFAEPSCAGGATPTYVCQDAATYVRSEQDPAKFTKALCYGAFPYFSEADANEVLSQLATRFVNLQRVYLGNLPDRDLADRFFKTPYDTAVLDDPLAPIGVWRTPGQLQTLAAAHGWEVELIRMPAGFYAAHYRYDAALMRLS